jgi:hypothetical protein
MFNNNGHTFSEYVDEPEKTVEEIGRVISPQFHDSCEIGYQGSDQEEDKTELAEEPYLRTGPSPLRVER